MMPTANGLLKGPKFNHNHSTVIGGAVEVIRFIESLDIVSKIVLAEIVPNAARSKRIRLYPIQAGFRLKIKSDGAFQIFYVYTKDPCILKDKIKKKWPDLYKDF